MALFTSIVLVLIFAFGLVLGFLLGYYYGFKEGNKRW